MSRRIKDFGAAVRDAWYAGRKIIPIVGAGLSADSGVPVIELVVSYLAKLQQYIDHNASFPPLKNISTRIDELFEGYKKKPWRYVEHLGWPDQFQLNQDLRAYLEKDGPTQEAKDRGLVQGAVDDGRRALTESVNPQGFDQYKEKLEKQIKEPLNSSDLFNMLADWRRLILYFTNYQSDYADAMFGRFIAGRYPGQGHRFLAFLVKLLGVRTVFTFNFDPLIEQALETEGARPTVFAMERGAALPHHSLIRDLLSVIKMHGSTHALLLDEQLDRPLTDEYTDRFDLITGPVPLLLVLGCSSYEKRLMGLVKHVIKRHPKDGGGKKPAVLWLHYEAKPPPFLKDLADNERACILTRQTNNPGATLLHLYSWLTSRNPAGRVPYLAHVQLPVPLGKSQGLGWKNGPNFRLLSTLRDPRSSEYFY